MTTIADSVKAQLDADWTGAGGTEPTYYVTEDYVYTNMPPTGEDYIWIIAKIKTKIDPVNDTFSNKTHPLHIIVNSATTADRLKTISDEVERILNATAISGATWQKVTERDIIPPDKTKAHQEMITVTIKQHMVSSASAYGTGTTADFVTVGDLQVGGDDIKDSGGNIVLSFDGSGNIDALAPIEVPITSSGVIALQPSGDTDDYFEFSTISNVPTLTLKGTHLFDVKSDSATDLIIQLKEDDSNRFFFGWSKTPNEGVMRTYGGLMRFQSAADIKIQPDNDIDDYWYFSSTANIASILPVEDKVHLIGSASLSADNMYSDDFTNTSPFKKFDKPLDELNKIKEKGNKIDYKSIPEWVRTVGHDYSKQKSEQYTDDKGELRERVIERAPKNVVIDNGWSVNRMVVLLYQALQEATTRIEALERK